VRGLAVEKVSTGGREKNTQVLIVDGLDIPGDQQHGLHESNEHPYS